jgi:hypothetical protein
MKSGGGDAIYLDFYALLNSFCDWITFRWWEFLFYRNIAIGAAAFLTQIP